MTSLNAEAIWRMSKKEIVSLIESGAVPNRQGTIRFYAPSFVHYKNKYFRTSHNAFPSISITGSSCSLKCKHCNGKVLDTMVPTMTPAELFDVCVELKDAGAVYEDKEVVVDGNLVTSRQPSDLPDFMRETLKLLKQG